MSATERCTALRLGFIGGALNSAVGYAHFAAATMDNSWSIDAGCFSLDQEANRETATAYGVLPERVHEDWRAMLSREREDLDAVVVLTPTPSHFEIVEGCLAAGIPVICEKALVARSEEAAKLRSLRQDRGGFLAVTYNYTGYPMLRELRDVIRRGELGKVLHFQAEMPQEGFIRTDPRGNKPSPQRWRLADGRVPTIHLDLAVHLHQIVHYLIGATPLETIADQGSYGWFSQVVDNVTALVRYSDGIQGQMWFSKSALGPRNGLRIRVFGSRASAEWYQMNPEELVVCTADGRRETRDRAALAPVAATRRYNRFKAGHPAGFIEAFANLYVDLADCVRQYREGGSWHSPEVFGVELAQEGLLLLEAMRDSVDRKSWQAVGRSVALDGKVG